MWPMSQAFSTRDRIAKLVRVSLNLIYLCVFASVLGGNAADAAQANSGGPGDFSPRFAIADFDGDRVPDLATVQVVQNAAKNSIYSVRVQLSAGEESAIVIPGPQGGLELVARDVNGDDVLDLIVTTAMDPHFVAILINDGHGKFTIAKPGAFPSIESKQGVRLFAASVPAEECAALQLTRSSFGIEALPDSGTGPAQKSNLSLDARCRMSLTDAFPGKPARSPPFGVSQS